MFAPGTLPGPGRDHPAATGPRRYRPAPLRPRPSRDETGGHGPSGIVALDALLQVGAGHPLKTRAKARHSRQYGNLRAVASVRKASLALRLASW
jgi:hypothetical protein